MIHFFFPSLSLNISPVDRKDVDFFCKKLSREMKKIKMHSLLQ